MTQTTSNKILSEGAPCQICKRKRFYKTQKGLEKGKNKPCISCANSIKTGGSGWTEFCIDCNENKRVINSLCKRCANKRSRQYFKEVYSWKQYGLGGPIEKTECELCKTKDDLVIDHCHKTNKFRGVLCRHCNTALGLLKEDPELIHKASLYVKDHQ